MKEINTYKVFKRLFLWSFPLITDVHVPEGGKNTFFSPCSLLEFLSLLLKPTNILVKVSEEVDSECVLFVKFVPICILNSLESLGGSSVLQKDVPVEDISTMNTS